MSGNLLVSNLLNNIYHKKLQTDGIAVLNKGSLNYSEQNKLSEGSYRNVYLSNYEGMSVFVKQFKRIDLHKIFIEANVLQDYQPSDIMNISLTPSQ